MIIDGRASSFRWHTLLQTPMVCTHVPFSSDLVQSNLRARRQVLSGLPVRTPTLHRYGTDRVSTLCPIHGLPTFLPLTQDPIGPQTGF